MIDKTRLLTGKAGMSYFQIIILITATFAFAYFVYHSSADLESVKSLDEREDGAIGKILKGIIESIKQPLLPIVSADDSFYCCERTKTGGKCLDATGEQKDAVCDANFSILPGKCEEFSGHSCEIGCCYNSLRGSCSPRSARADCTFPGIFIPGESCNIPECESGCCYLGGVRRFTTERECEFLTNSSGLASTEFHDEIKTDFECFILAEEQEQGACIFEQDSERNCRFLSAAECAMLRGEFQSSSGGRQVLCTNPDLDTTCTMSNETMCVEGKDEVYFKDSCGNPANIYDASKAGDINYWKFKLTKSEACNSSSGNLNSPGCGNCDSILGGICGAYRPGIDSVQPEYGNNICRDLNCYNAPANVGTQDRVHGESWCVYDGLVGDGKDVVGSRHWVYSCVFGEIRKEGCADFRNEICVQAIDENTSISTASCRVNRWQMCIEANNNGSIETKCGGNSDCLVKNVQVGKWGFSFCAPQYPPGFDLLNEGSKKSSESVCNQASVTCNVLWVKKDKKSSWKCEKNCECQTSLFAQQMNDLCIGLGDCGGYVNYEGEYTSGGYKIENIGGLGGTPELTDGDIQTYKGYSNPVEGNFANPGNLSEFLEAFGIPGGDNGTSEKSESGSGGIGSLAVIGATAGAAGVLYLIWSHDPTNSLLTGAETWAYIKGGAGAVESSVVTCPFFNAAGGAFLGAMIGGLLGALLGVEGEQATLMTIGGAIGGGIGALLSGAILSWGSIAGGIIGALIGWAIGSLFGLGGKAKTRIVQIKYTCLPWEQPTGGGSCTLCNQDSDKPCSKYRCQSLGKACEFINEGTSQEMCIAAEDDGREPEISPLYGVISEGYSYENVQDRVGFEFKNINTPSGCAQEFEEVLFGVHTHEPAICKFEFGHKDNFSSMNLYFGTSLPDYNHSVRFAVPSAEFLAYEFNLSTGQLVEQLSNLRLYLRCEDRYGHSNTAEYVIRMCIKPGPDKAPPVIRSISPPSGSFVAFNETEQNVRVVLNEPAECRYDTQNIDYDFMDSEMNCSWTGESNDFDCVFKMQNLSLGDNRVFIKCKDQPWLSPENQSLRNKMTTSVEYILKKSLSELSIDYISPSGEILSGTSLTSVELEVKTSGGAENGKSICRWGLSNASYPALFMQTNSDIHRQSLVDRGAGVYSVFVRCEDVGGNIAKSSTSFEIKIDTTPPRIVRAYFDGGLRIITNENSECAYSVVNCNFEWNENTTLMSGSEKEHSAEWQTDATYFIRCRDEYGRVPSGCSMRVRAYDLV